MATSATTPRAGLPQWKAADKVKFITDVSKAFADADANFALSGDAFIPCTADYDSVTKRHTLTPTQANIKLPAIFTAQFIATASFTKEDKIYISGKEYTPAYTDGAQVVQTGVWLLDAAVCITCVKTIVKAFVGAGSISQFALKANTVDVNKQLATKANAGFELPVINTSTISLSNVKSAIGIYGKNQIGQVEISISGTTLSSPITETPTPFLQMPVGYYPYFASRTFSVMLSNEGSNRGESGIVRISAGSGLVTVQKESSSLSANLKTIDFSQIYTAG